MKNLIKKGIQVKPINMILYGPAGVGKTTFASKAPSPIYISGEEIDEADVDKLPKCESYNDFIKYLAWVKDGDHDYQTLVIDTIDSIESLLWKHLLEEDGSADMARAYGGYGKSYILATQKLTEMRDSFLVPIRDKRNMNIVLLCHTSKNKFENPLTQSSYDMYEMKLHKSGKGIGAYTVFSEWVSMILFANYEVYITKEGKDSKKYAIGEGERIIHTSPKPAYDAKNRYNLPEELPLNWDDVADSVKAFYGNSKNPELDSLKIEIKDLIKKIPDEKVRNETTNNVKAVGDDIERLKKAKEYIRGIL